SQMSVTGTGSLRVSAMSTPACRAPPARLNSRCHSDSNRVKACSQRAEELPSKPVGLPGPSRRPTMRRAAPDPAPRARAGSPAPAAPPPAAAEPPPAAAAPSRAAAQTDDAPAGVDATEDRPADRGGVTRLRARSGGTALSLPGAGWRARGLGRAALALDADT